MSGVDEQYIEELARDRRETFRGFHDAVAEYRKARNLEDMSIDDIPEAYRTTTQLIQLPRVPDILQRMASITTDDDPVITRPPQDATETAQRDASKVEHWLQGAIDRMARDADRDPWRMAMDAALADGLGVMKLVDDKHAWDDEPRRSYEEEDEQGQKTKREKEAKTYLKEVEDFRKGAQFPFLWSDVNCLTYFPVSTGRRVSEVLEITKRPIIPTAKALGVKATSLNNKGKLRWKKLRLGERFDEKSLPSGAPTSVECMEYWTSDRVYYLLDGEIADERDHNYRRPPYFHFGSYTTSAREPEKQFRSAIANVRHLVKGLNRFLTIMSNWGFIAGFPFLVEDGNSNLGGDKALVSQVEPGAILRGVKFLEPPNVAAVLDKLVQLLMAEADRASLSAVMYGYGGGTSSGYQVASLQAAAQSVLKPALRNASQALEQLLAHLLYMVEHVIADKVYVWGRGDGQGQNAWLRLEPKDIRGYYALQVELRPLLPLDEIAQRDSALRMTQGGLWSKRFALTKTGEEQPEEILDEIAVEQYMEQPAIAQRIAEDAAQRAGLIKPTPQGPQIFGPNGAPLSSAAGPQVGGPGMPAIGPMGPVVPGAGMPLRPTPPPMGGANMPEGVQRGPGGPNLNAGLGG